MKILEINKFNYLRRGAEKHYLDVIALLKSRGHEVAVFSMDHPQNLFSPWKKYFVSYAGFGAEDSFYSKLKGLFRIYSFEAKRKIGKLLDDFQPDVVHIHNIYHHISPSILKEIKKRGIPVIMTIHDFNLICPDYSLLCGGKRWDELEGNRFKYFIKNKCFKKSYLKSILAVLEFKFNKHFGFYEKYVDRFIVPSNFVKEIFEKEGIDPGKIDVVSHFVYKDPLTCAWPKDKELYRDRYVFYCGSISAEKGVDKLVDIFENIRGAKLYLAGKIESGFVLPKKFKIKYLGFLDARQIEKYMGASLLVVLPSRLPETFGLTALEAASNGKPVICFDSGAFGEIVVDNKTGFICADEKDMAEKTQRLINDEGLCILFGRNSLERAMEFNSNTYYDKFLKVIDKIRKKC